MAAENNSPTKTNPIFSARSRMVTSCQNTRARIDWSILGLLVVTVNVEFWVIESFHRGRGDADVFVSCAVVEKPTIFLASQSFDKNHIWHLADFLPGLLRLEHRLIGA